MYTRITNEIEIDRNRHCVRRGKTDIHLTGLEFGLLDYLTAHPNRVCKRSELLDAVWGERFQYDTGTIDVHLNALRRKLGWTTKMPVETIRGIGFIFHNEHSSKGELPPLDAIAYEWIRANEGSFAAQGLKPVLRLTPWVNSLTISPEQLRRWLDASLNALTPLIQTKGGTLSLSSRLTMHFFALTLDINGNSTELKIPVNANQD